LPFNIELSDLVIPETCPILGIPLRIDENGLKRTRSDYSPTIDRVIPSKGYVKGNVAIISLRANRKKQDSSIEEVEHILAYMKRYDI